MSGPRRFRAGGLVSGAVDVAADADAEHALEAALKDDPVMLAARNAPVRQITDEERAIFEAAEREEQCAIGAGRGEDLASGKGSREGAPVLGGDRGVDALRGRS